MTHHACNRLLAKLIVHHPEYAPDELRTRLAPPPPPPEPPAAAPEIVRRIIPRKQPTISDIVHVIEWFYELPAKTLYRKSRANECSWTRQIAFYLTRKLIHAPRYSYRGPISFQRISRYFQLDHSSIMNGIDTLTERLAEDERLRDEVELITAHIKDLLAGKDLLANDNTVSFTSSRLFLYYREKNPPSKFVPRRAITDIGKDA